MKRLLVSLIALLLYSGVAQASVFEDPYDNTTYISSQTGSEVTGGTLININQDEGTVLDFDGSNDYVTAGSDASIDNIFSGGGTVSVWLKPDTGLATYGVPFFDKLTDAGHGGWTLRVFDTANIRFYVYYDGTDGEWRTATGTIPLGRWTHFAVTFSSSATTAPVFYINGIPVVVTTTTTPTGTYQTDAANDLDVARGYIIAFAGERYWDGGIDDLRVWKGTALTASQIYQIFSTGANPSTPTLEYRMNDGSGTNVDDTGSAAQDGTLSGATWTTSHQPFYTVRSQTASTEVLSGQSATAVSNFKYTTAKKPGGSEARLQFSSDGSTWKNANGDSVTNAAGYSFDGVNDNISTGQTLATMMSNTTGTMSCWLRWDKTTVSSGTASNIPAATSDSSGYTAIAYGTVGGVTGIHAYNYDGSADVVSFPANQGEWYHVVWQHTGGTLYLYINGALVGSTASGNTSVTTGTMLIGSNWTSATARWFQGNIDDVRFYNIALTATEIWNLYSRHKESYNSSTGLEGWYKLDDSGSGTAVDSSGNGYDGTVSGATGVSSFYDLPAFGEGTTDDVDTLSFDGVNDVAKKSTANYRSGDSTGSIQAWVYRGGTGTRDTIFAAGDEGGIALSFVSFFIETTGELNIAQRSNGGSSFEVETNEVVPTNQWTHVAVTSNGTAYTLYINGVAQTLKAGTNDGDWFADTINLDNITIGLLDTSTDYDPFIGQIANVAVYSSELSASQILTDFKNGYPSTTNAVNIWKMNEGTGDLSDSVGSDTLTVSGATWTKNSARPIPTTASQITVDVSGLGYTSAFYSRAYMHSYQNTPDRSYAFAETSVDYTGGSTRYLKNYWNNLPIRQENGNGIVLQ